MQHEYDQEADALGCYELCMSEMAKRMNETGEIPDALLGPGAHSQRLLEESKLRGVRNAESGRFALPCPDLDSDCCPGCGSTIPDAHLREDCPALTGLVMDDPLVGIGSDGKTVALTLWSGGRKLVKIMDPLLAVQTAHRILREACHLLGRT